MGMASPQAGSSKGRASAAVQKEVMTWGRGCFIPAPHAAPLPTIVFCGLSLLSSKRHNFSSPFKLVFVLQQFVTQPPRMTCQTYNGYGLCKQGISPSPSVVLWLGYTSVRCQRAFNMLSFALPFDPQALSGLYKVGFSQHLTMKRLLYFSLTLNLVRVFLFHLTF